MARQVLISICSRTAENGQIGAVEPQNDLEVASYLNLSANVVIRVCTIFSGKLIVGGRFIDIRLGIKTR